MFGFLRRLEHLDGFCLMGSCARNFAGHDREHVCAPEDFPELNGARVNARRHSGRLAAGFF
jgi:hypothetical protein